MEALWAQLLAPPRESVADLRQWQKFQLDLTARVPHPFDQALLGGHASSTCAFAFAFGYRAALGSIFSLEPGEVGALCVTEDQGAHPKHIATRVSQDLRLSGQKSYVTMGTVATTLFILASRGERSDGTKDFVVVRLPSDRSGIRIEALPPTPFVPELPHARIELSEVELSGSEVLPKDGYLEYAKPFRTVEDIHVQGAILGFLARAAIERSWPSTLFERISSAAVTLRALSTEDPKQTFTHLALAGAIQEVEWIVDATQSAIDSRDDEWAKAWRRDHVLLRIAEKARQKRRERAWEQVQ